MKRQRTRLVIVERCAATFQQMCHHDFCVDKRALSYPIRQLRKFNVVDPIGPRCLSENMNCRISCSALEDLLVAEIDYASQVFSVGNNFSESFAVFACQNLCGMM